MSRPFPKRGDGALYCYLCDGEQPDGTRQCRLMLKNNRGICGRVAFYRVRRPGGARPAPVEEEVVSPTLGRCVGEWP